MRLTPGYGASCNQLNKQLEKQVDWIPKVVAVQNLVVISAEMDTGLYIRTALFGRTITAEPHATPFRLRRIRTASHDQLGSNASSR